VGVGDGKAVGYIAGHHSIVGRVGLFIHGFLHRINDEHALAIHILELGQVVELPSPVVSSGSGGGGNRLFSAISIQLDGHAGGTETILIVAVLPSLGAIDTGHLGGMGVGHIVAGHNGSVIAFHLFFGNGVDNLNAAIAELIQALSRPVPFAILASHDLNGFCKLAISQQVNRNAIGTDAILIVVIVPDLLTGNGDLLGIVSVGDDVALNLGVIPSGYVNFGEGVHNLAALTILGLVLVQIVEGPGPHAVCISGDGLLTRIRAISQQLNGNGSGTLAIAVVVVLPNLLAGDAGLLGHMDIGDGVHTIGTRHLSPITIGHIGLNHGVVDGLAILVLGQVVPGVSPGVIGVQGNGIAFVVAIGQQLHNHAVGADVVAVVVVIPGLGHSHIGLLGHVSVGNGGDSANLFAALEGITRGQLFFFPSVADLNAIGILGQVLHLGSPMVTLVQGHDMFSCLAVSLQRHIQAGGTDVIAVAVIVPDLDHSGFGLFGRVAVGQGGDSAVLGSIAQAVTLGHVAFRPGVGDLAAVGILGQILNSSAPVVGLVQGHNIAGSHAIGVQGHRQALRTLAILVVGVVPNLLHGGNGLFGGMGVGDGSQCTAFNGSRLIASLGIISRHSLAPGVGDFHTIGILGQVLNGSSPLVLLVQHNLGAVGELHRQAGGALAILVGGIGPNLLHGSLGSFGGVLVGHGEAIGHIARIGNFITSRHSILLHGVLNSRALIILGQASPSHRLYAIKSNGLALLAIHKHFVLPNLLVQAEGHVSALAILVVVVIPNLGGRHVNSLGGIAVGDGVAFSSSTGDALAVTRYIRLVHGVNDVLTGILQVQVRPGVGPLVGLTQGNGITLGSTVSIQLHLNKRGPLAILIGCIVPSLGHSNAGLARSIAVSNDEAFPVLSGVALHRIFGDGVHNLAAFSILGQILKGEGPGIIHNLAGNFRAIGLQAHGDAAGAVTVLVIGVVPNLFTRDVDLLGGMTVGHNGAQLVHVIGVNHQRDGIRGVVRHGILSHGVGDQLTVGKLGQVAQGSRPAVGGRQRDGGIFHIAAIGLHVHNHRRGPHAILIVVILPILGHGDGHRLRGIGIGDGQLVFAQALLIASGHRDFVSSPHDGRRGAIVHRQFLIGVGPLVCGALQFNRLTICSTILVQLHLHEFGTLAVLVVVIRPDLLHDDVGNCGGMDVGNGIGNRAIRLAGLDSASRRITIGYRCFLNSIGNSLTIGILGQVLPGVAPGTILAGQCDGIANIGFAILQLHADGFGTDTILVAVVLPILSHLNINGFRRVGVGDRAAIHSLGVAVRHNNFVNGIDDLVTTGQLGQVLPGVGPGTILTRQRHGTTDIGISVLQLHADGIRTVSILVVFVFPHLSHRKGNRFRRVCIGNGIGNSVIRSVLVTGNRRRVAVGHISFFNFIVNSRAGGILGQVVPGIGPAISRVQGNGSTLSSSVGLQLHINADRTDTGLIINVIPCLGHRHAGLGRRERIHQGGDIVLGRIAGQGIARGQRFFRPGVGGQLAIHVLGQVIHGGGPAVAFVQGNLCAIGQGNLQLRRTDAILVVVVVPFLLHGNGNRNGLQGVGDGIARSGIASHIAGVIRRDVDLLDGVIHNLAVQLGIQISPGVPPAIGLVQGHRFAAGNAVGQKLHLNRLRTLALSIVDIVPHLVDGDIHIFGKIGVGQSGNFAIGDIAGQHIFVDLGLRPLIFNQFTFLGSLRAIANRNPFVVGRVPIEVGGQAILILAQTGNGQFPRRVSLAGEDKGTSVAQRNLQRTRTHAGLVVAVVPDLLDGRRGRVRLGGDVILHMPVRHEILLNQPTAIIHIASAIAIIQVAIHGAFPGFLARKRIETLDRPITLNNSARRQVRQRLHSYFTAPVLRKGTSIVILCIADLDAIQVVLNSENHRLVVQVQQVDTAGFNSVDTALVHNGLRFVVVVIRNVVDVILCLVIGINTTQFFRLGAILPKHEIAVLVIVYHILNIGVVSRIEIIGGSRENYSQMFAVEHIVLADVEGQGFPNALVAHLRVELVQIPMVKVYFVGAVVAILIFYIVVVIDDRARRGLMTKAIRHFIGRILGINKLHALVLAAVLQTLVSRNRINAKGNSIRLRQIEFGVLAAGGIHDISKSHVKLIGRHKVAAFNLHQQIAIGEVAGNAAPVFLGSGGVRQIHLAHQGVDGIVIEVHLNRALEILQRHIVGIEGDSLVVTRNDGVFHALHGCGFARLMHHHSSVIFLRRDNIGSFILLKDGFYSLVELIFTGLIVIVVVVRLHRNLQLGFAPNSSILGIGIQRNSCAASHNSSLGF